MWINKYILYIYRIYSCRWHTQSYPTQAEYYPLYDQHFLNPHIIVGFVLSFHHFLPCCHNELTGSRPTPTHPIQLAESLKRTTAKLRDTATSSFKLQNPFVENFVETTWQKIGCIYSNPLTPSLETLGQVSAFRGKFATGASVNVPSPGCAVPAKSKTCGVLKPKRWSFRNGCWIGILIMADYKFLYNWALYIIPQYGKQITPRGFAYCSKLRDSKDSQIRPRAEEWNAFQAILKSWSVQVELS